MNPTTTFIQRRGGRAWRAKQTKERWAGRVETKAERFIRAVTPLIPVETASRFVRTSAWIAGSAAVSEKVRGNLDLNCDGVPETVSSTEVFLCFTAPSSSGEVFSLSRQTDSGGQSINFVIDDS
jgi:hypothetical protein